MSPAASSTTVVRRRRASTRKQRSNSFCLRTEPFDLSPSQAPLPTLASVRILVLAQLADIEQRLAQLESPVAELHKLKSTSEVTVEDAKTWVRDAKDMVRSIREEVKSHLPDIQLDMASVENLIRMHLPDWSDVRALLPELPDFSFEDMRSRLSELELPSIRSHLPQLDSVVPTMKSHLASLDKDFQDFKLDYLPKLSNRLQSLHTHLSSVHFPSTPVFPSFAPAGLLCELLDRVLASDVFADLLSPDSEQTVQQEERFAAKTVSQVAKALQLSSDGTALIKYHDLPEKWKNNEFVQSGYRFIPLSNWPALAFSAVRLHNETLNIHTHLLPLILSLLSWTPVLGLEASDPLSFDLPDKAYINAARLCLLTSSVWHIFSGCADPSTMEFFARLDYVGIGWLISASVATIVYYGLSCHPHAAAVYLLACLASGVAGSVLPFMAWFNERKHKKWRILFFLSLAFTSAAPVAHMSAVHSTSSALGFVWPIVPSLLSYIIGLVLYAYHLPECLLPETRPRWLRWTDFIGGGGHAIWHVFIIYAIRLHRRGMMEMRNGFEGEFCSYW